MIQVGFLNYLEDKLAKVEDKMVSYSSGYHPDLMAALDHLMAAGGKRIRPIITLLMGMMMGAEEEKLKNYLERFLFEQGLLTTTSVGS